ncbi:MAG: hypothetical protein MI725_10780 [Pirellulales bacterium]|nr:hypothetical protein [Pirellulales bacterium]
MASPFRIFRKYQKAFLAIAAVLAMIIFVFADLLTGALSSPASSGRDNLTLATWDSGSMTARELEALLQRRIFISRFLSDINQTGGRRLIDNGGTPLRLSIPSFILAENASINQVYVGCVSTRILSQLAQEAGIAVSDHQLSNYLKEMSYGQLEGHEIVGMLPGNRSQTERRLLAGLRELLLGNTYLSNFESAIASVTPEQRWQDWRRINERISLDAAIVPAARFVSKVPEPSEIELSQFYELHKDNVGGLQQYVMGRLLPAPSPGFREPRRVKLQYLLGDVAAKTQELLDSVTEEAIADYYERNKRQMFVKARDTAREAPPDDSGPGETRDESQTEDAAPTADFEQPDRETDNPAESEQSEQPQDNASGGTLPSRSPFRLVVLQDGEAETGETAEAETETSEESTDSENVETEGDEVTEDDQEDLEFEPLENVRDQIRSKLATDKAVIQLQPLADKAYGKLDAEYRPYGLEVAEAEEKKAERPAPPANLADLKAMASELGLVYQETALLPASDLAEKFVGRATDAQNRRVRVVEAAFGALALYEPFLAKDLDGNWYVVNKVEDKPTRIPPLDEIRDQVIDAWKKREAAKLALEKAEQLAKELEASGEALDLFFAGQPYETVTTDMFSWQTFGSIPLEYQPRPPQLGEAPPLEAVGPDFMSTVFSLEPEKVAALMNHSQTNAYVFKLASREQSRDQLRQQFLEEANTSIASLVLLQVRTESSNRALINQIMSQVDLNTDALEEYLRPK